MEDTHQSVSSDFDTKNVTVPASPRSHDCKDQTHSLITGMGGFLLQSVALRFGRSCIMNYGSTMLTSQRKVNAISYSST